MITSIFIPEKIGSYYLLSKRIIGFDLAKTHVYASQIYLSGNGITLEKFYQEPVDPDTSRPYTIRVGEAIERIMRNAPYCNDINTSLSSSVVIFKELQLPFIDTEKISMVLPYEIEPYLPFSLADAIAGFIITKTNLEEKTSNILVAAVQKIYVQEHLDYFAKAKLNPTKISIDLFDLYGLYSQIPAYGENKKTVVLIDIEFQVTRIAFILQGQLKLVRTLAKGIAQCTKNVAQALRIPNGQALETIIRFGLEKHDDPDYSAIVKESMSAFFKEIQFTLQSCITQTKTDQSIDQILLLGRGADIPNIDIFAHEMLQIPCSYFDGNELLKIPTIRMKHVGRIPRTNIMSLSTAFPSKVTENLTMRKEEFALPTSSTFNKQFFTALTLFFLTFVILIGDTYWQKRTLTKQARSMEQDVVRTLNDLGLTEEKAFNEAIEDAEQKVSNDEEVWFAFSRQRRFSFLKVLQDLSTAIDRKAIGLLLKKLVLNKTTNDIIFEGQVKGIDELEILERELQDSKLFRYVPSLQEKNINVSLPLKKNGEAS
jgi:type IV pilus assembly protein PilM